MKHRLFIGLRPPENIITQLSDVMGDIAGARWQSDAQLHLTLLFLGACDHHQAEDVAHSLLGVHFPCFTLQVDGLGHFQKPGQAGSLWAAVRPHAPLLQLHQKLTTRLRPLGLDLPARAYLPHITLARLDRYAGSPAAFLAQYAGLSSAPFAVTEFCLFESHRTRAGAHYEIVARYALARGA